MPSSGSSHGTLTIYTNVDTKGLQSGLNGITKTFNKLSSAMKMSVGIAGMLALGKSAVDAASDLKEYRNVAEVTFGRLIYMLDNLTETSIEAYGMSKLMATQAASGFMAMGNAAGIARRESAEMAIGLTKYMADFASFYNLSHERARTALAAVYTGETETLKQYGIMLQEVNLQQFENERGLGRSIKTMTAAEKAQLRYNYIMFVGKDAMGDFARTSDNWANQVRVLTERWKELLIQLGNGAITVLTPLVKLLNNLIDVTQRYTKVLGDALATIFGIQWQELSDGYKSAADEAFEYADAEDAIADATDKSTKSANKALQSFDKLNVIRTAEVPGADGESIPVFNTGSFEESADAIKDSSGLIESAINSLFKLGKYMAENLQETLDNIDWNAVYDKFSDFGTGVAQYLNGAFSVEALSSVAKTLAGSLNAIIEMAIGLMSELDWEEVGNSIAVSLISFFETFNAERLAEALNLFVDGIMTALEAAIETKPWKSVFSAIGRFLDTLEVDTIALVIGAITVTKVGKLLLGEIGMLLSTSLATGISSALGTTAVLSTFTAGLKALFGSKAAQSALVFMFPKTAGAVTGLTTRVSALLRSLFGSKAAQSSLVYLFPNATALFNNISDGVREVHALTAGGAGSLWESVDAVFGTGHGLRGALSAVDDGITKIRDNMSGFLKGAIGIASITAEFGIMKDAMYEVTSGTKDFDDVLGKIIATAGLAGTAMYVAFGPTGVAFAAVAGIVGAVSGAIKGIEESLEKAKLEALFTVISEAGRVSMEDMTTAATNMLESITANVDPTVEKLKSISTAKEDVDKTVKSINSIKTAIENGAYSVGEKVPELIDHFKNLLTQSESIFEQEYAIIVGNIMGAWADVLEAQGQSVPAIVAALASMRNEGTKTFATLEEQLGAYIQQYQEGIMSEEEFLKKVTPLIDQLIAFNDTGIADTAIEEMQDLIGALDVSKFMDGDTFNVELFERELQKVADAAEKGKIAFDEFGRSSEDAIEDMRHKMEVLGIDVSDFDWAVLYGANEETVRNGKAEIDAAYKQYADTIQYNVLKMLPDVVDGAVREYNARPWYERLFELEDDFVAGVVNEWTSSVFDPMSNSLEKAFISLGVDAELWAEEAQKDLYDSIFSVHAVGQGLWAEDEMYLLNPEWKKSLQDSLDEIRKTYTEFFYGPSAPQGWSKKIGTGINDALQSSAEFIGPPVPEGFQQSMKQFGENVVVGFNEGLNAQAGSSADTVNDWMKSVKVAIHDSDMQFGSPSRTAYDFGEDTVVGFNDGLAATYETTFDIIRDWMSDLVLYMNTQMRPLITSVANSFNQSLDVIASETDRGLTGMTDSVRRATTSMYDTIAGFLSNVESLLSRKSGILNFMGNIGTTGVSASIFRGVKIPMLASGAVIPPNRQFLAMLGDQKHGTNVEAPLDTIKQAVAEVISQMGGAGDRGDIVIQISGREIARVVRDEDREHINRTGNSMFAY